MVTNFYQKKNINLFKFSEIASGLSQCKSYKYKKDKKFIYDLVDFQKMRMHLWGLQKVNTKFFQFFPQFFFWQKFLIQYQSFEMHVILI